MKSKKIVLALAAMLAVGLACYAAGDAFNGTWKLNEAKSKIGAGAARNSTVVYAADGDSIKVTIDGTKADGTPLHSEWTGKYDGKDYPVTGDPSTDARSYKLVNDRRLSISSKKDGKVVSTTSVMVSADGKSRTTVTDGVDAKGMKMSATSVYDKQ